MRRRFTRWFLPLAGLLLFGCMGKQSLPPITGAGTPPSTSGYGGYRLGDRGPFCRPVRGPDAPFFIAHARKLGLCLDGTENKALLRAVDRWMGTRYRWGGCTRRGIDCSCLVKAIFREAYGIDLHRTSRMIYQNDLTPVPASRLREGDILCFRIESNRISHIGIYLKNGKFVHVSRKRGVKINDLSQPYYRKRFMAGGRVKALSEKRAPSGPVPAIRLENLLISGDDDPPRAKNPG